MKIKLSFTHTKRKKGIPQMIAKKGMTMELARRGLVIWFLIK